MAEPLLEIDEAFNKKLALIAPALSTAYEGVSFDPVSGVPYQRVKLVPRNPVNPTLGNSYYREVGEYQIYLAYPTNRGKYDIITRAGLIRDAFPRGTTLVESGSIITITRTPSIMGTTIVGDRIILPIIIQYSAEV